jgi:translation initiation factor 2 gamma subunit (eIF-2gamma)
MITNKTKRGRKFKEGYWDRYTWKCAECGREWRTQQIARSCKRQGHPDSMTSTYTDDIERPLNDMELRKPDD